MAENINKKLSSKTKILIIIIGILFIGNIAIIAAILPKLNRKDIGSVSQAIAAK